MIRKYKKTLNEKTPKLETILNKPEMAQIIRNMRYIQDRFRNIPSVVKMIESNKCLPILIDDENGYITYIDFTRTVPNNYQEYMISAQQSIDEAMAYGLFHTNYRC